MAKSARDRAENIIDELEKYDWTYDIENGQFKKLNESYPPDFDSGKFERTWNDEPVDHTDEIIDLVKQYISKNIIQNDVEDYISDGVWYVRDKLQFDYPTENLDQWNDFIIKTLNENIGRNQ
jgi:hypothetical protein